MVVPQTPGGAVDRVARMLADRIGSPERVALPTDAPWDHPELFQAMLRLRDRER